MNKNTKIPLILPAEPFRPDAPRISEMSNGVKLYAFPRGDQDIVKIDVVFEAGTVHQPISLVSLLTGTLLKEGSRSYNSGHIAYQLDFHGAFLEFTNGFHYSTLSLYALNKHLPKLLPLLASIIHEPLFPEKEFEVILDNRKQEFLVNLQKVKLLAAKDFSRRLWGVNHPYAQQAAEEDFDKVNTGHLQRFYNAHYSANKCTLFVSGRVDEKVINIIDKYLCVGWNGSTPENGTLSFTAEPENPGIYYVPKEGVQSAVKAGRHVMDKGDEAFPAFQLLCGVLGGYFGSRLMRNIREDKGYTYGIGSYVVNQPLGSYLAVSTETANEYRDAVIGEIKHEMVRLQREAVPEAELQMVKNYLSGEMMRSFDGPFAITDVYRSLWENGLNFDFIERYLEVMDATTSETLQALSEKWLNPDDLIISVAGNEK
ncbi:M16 family metallopeptidase [Saccharicrinis sp. FJH54]|uniref:M16 family metallopeptidase n=1 Tax=Saccharicrinis sp. FJH54 TaxID=3344665 RepID=UPI0035D48A29